MAQLVDFSKPLMPKQTTAWLVEHTTLTFEQISDFTGLPFIEVEGIADGDIHVARASDPITEGVLTREELTRCEEDESASLKSNKKDLPPIKSRVSGPRYTPVAKRGDKPNAVAYIIKHHPEISEAQIVKLVGTTKPTIKAIRERTHANISNITPKHPADLGLVSYTEFEAVLEKAMKAAGKTKEDAIKAQEEARASITETADQETQSSEDKNGSGNIDFSNFL